MCWPVARWRARFGVRRKGVALFDAILQLLHGIRVIKIYQGEQAEGDRTIECARSYLDELIHMERVRAFARVVLGVVGRAQRYRSDNRRRIQRNVRQPRLARAPRFPSGNACRAGTSQQHQQWLPRNSTLWRQR